MNQSRDSHTGGPGGRLRRFAGAKWALVNRTARLGRKYGLPLLTHATPRRWHNLLLTEWHLRRGDVSLRSLPPVVAIDPTNICTLHCPLCPTGQGYRARPLGRMAFDFYRGIVDQIASRSYKVILHNWGEPLLHPEIVDMVEYASRKGLATELSTNLNTLPDRMPADLVRAGLERIVISIDGATQESYENYRRGGRLSDVLANLRRIAEAKKELRSRTPVIEASALIMRSNEKELEAVARQAEEAGADRFELRCIIVNVLDQRQVEEWLPTDTRYVRYDESLKRDRLSEAGRRCSWPWRSLVVNWDGTVYPCCNFERKEAEVGDLRNTSLADLWNGELYRDIRRLFAGKRPPVPSLSDASNICEWCAGIPRAPSATQAGVY